MLFVALARVVSGKTAGAVMSCDSASFRIGAVALTLVAFLAACSDPGSPDNNSGTPSTTRLTVRDDTLRIDGILRFQLTVEPVEHYTIGGELRYSNGGIDWQIVPIIEAGSYVVPILSSCFLARWKIELLNGSWAIERREGSRFEGVADTCP
jgi:hypothetical protein